MLTSDAEYFYWSKGDNETLTASFSTPEFTCHCAHASCVNQKISKSLVNKLQSVRTQLGAPLRVTSGYRCSEKQAELRAQGFETAKGVSQHELGNAADIAATSMQSLHTLCEALFSAIGVAKSFVHVDTRPPHADGTKRLWSYK